MKYLLFAFALSLIVLCTESQAQQNAEYLAMIVSGDVSYQKSNQKEWQKVVVGQRLDKKFKIKIVKGYLSIIHKSGKTIELKEDGIFDLKNLLKQTAKVVSDLKRKIAEYVFTKLTETPNKAHTEDIVGGVERGILETKSLNEILCYYPQNTKVITKEVPFCWSSIKPGVTYTLTLTDKVGKKLLERQVKDTTVKIDIDALNGEKGTCIYWQVSSEKFTSKQYCLLTIYKKEIDSINDGAMEMLSKCDIKSATDNLLIALYYEEKKVMYKAVEYYQNAVTLAPNVATYKDLLRKYLNLPQAY